MSNLITSASIVRQTPSKGGDVVQTDEGILQFYLDPVVKKPITHGKGAGVNVQAKSLTMYFADMTFVIILNCYLYSQNIKPSSESSRAAFQGSNHPQATC